MKILATWPRKLALGITLCLAILTTLSLNDALSDSSGVTGRSKVGCTDCHGASAKPATIVTISTTATEIIAGQTYDFRLVVRNPTEKGAGCDISTQRGKIAASGTGLRLIAKELTHTSPRAFSGDSAVFTFKYTAPTTTGVDHIYAAGNAVNLNGTDDTKDGWNTTVFDINVVAPAGVESATPASDMKLIISPNPTANWVTLNLRTGEKSEITIEDAGGRVVRSVTDLMLDGAARLDVSNLANGSYWLRASSGGNAYQARFVVQK